MEILFRIPYETQGRFSRAERQGRCKGVVHMAQQSQSTRPYLCHAITVLDLGRRGQGQTSADLGTWEFKRLGCMEC